MQTLLRPPSLNMGLPRNNVRVEGFINNLKSVGTSVDLKPKEIMEDEKQNRVIGWLTNTVTWTDLAKAVMMEEELAYEAEIMFPLSRDEKGTKIERIVEFCDSKKQLEFHGMIMKAMNIVEK